MIYKKSLSSIPKKAFGEVAIIAAVFLVFFISGAISGIQDQVNVLVMYLDMLISLCLFIVSLRCWVKQKNFIRKDLQLKNLAGTAYKKCVENKALLILLCVTVLLRIPLLGTVQRWDGEAFLKAIINGCRNFDFTPFSYFKSFRLCGHTSLGYALFIAIGEYLSPENVYGINTVNLLLYLFYTFFLYRIISKIVPNYTDFQYAAATFVITSAPMALGTFGIINVDFPIMIFAVYVIYMHMSRRYILLVFFAGVLIQSKETGSVFLAGYMGAYFLYQLWKKREWWRNGALWAMAAAWAGMALYFIVLLWSGTILWFGGIVIGGSDEKILHYFGLIPEYICLKLKMIFGLNFYWLFTGISVILLLVLWVRIWKRSRERKAEIGKFLLYSEKVGIAAGVGGGIAGIFLFNCVYVTWSNPRYHYPLEAFLLFVTVVLILKVIRKSWIQNGMLALLALFCLAQSYTTVDWMAGKIFDTRDTGNGYAVVHPAWNAVERKYQPDHVLADMAVYNNQMSYLDKAYNRILEETGYDGTSDIIIWDDLPQYNGLSENSIYSYWDMEKKERIFYPKESAVTVHIVSRPWFQNEDNDKSRLAENAIYIFSPEYGINEVTAMEELEEYYSIGTGKEVVIWGQGSVTYYEMKRKV